MRREISTIVYKNHPRFNNEKEAREFIKNNIDQKDIEKTIERDLNRYGMDGAKVVVVYNWRSRELSHIYYWDYEVQLGDYDIVLEKR